MESTRQAAEALHKEGRLEEAEVMYRQLQAASPTDAQLTFAHARLLLERAEAASTAADEESSIRAETSSGTPESADKKDEGPQEGWMRQARALLAQGRAIAPNDPLGDAVEGLIAYLGEELESARGFFQKALQGAPSLEFALFRQGQCDNAMGLLQAAKQNLETLLNLAPDHARAHYELATVTMGLEQLDETVEILTRACTLQPPYLPSVLLLGDLYIETEQFAAARTLYEQMLSKVSGDDALAALHEGLLSLALGQGQLEEAVSHAEKIASLRADADDWRNLANLLMAAGETTQAEAAYQEARERAPEDWMTHLAIAEFYAHEMGGADPTARDDAWTRAKDAYEEAIKLAPDAHEPLDGLGVLYLANARKDEALEQAQALFAQAHTLAPQEAEPTFHLALCHAKAQRWTQAKDLAKQALTQSTPQEPLHAQIEQLLAAIATRNP